METAQSRDKMAIAPGLGSLCIEKAQFTHWCLQTTAMMQRSTSSISSPASQESQDREKKWRIFEMINMD
jgi:hypothetical protein